jgi:hypothetical protein
MHRRTISISMMLTIVEVIYRRLTKRLGVRQSYVLLLLEQSVKHGRRSKQSSWPDTREEKLTVR